MAQFHPDPLLDTPCAKCGGRLEHTSDGYGHYIRCFNCGQHTYPDRGGREASAAGWEDLRPDVRWYPTRQTNQERYRTIRETIRRECLSIEEAMRRFECSRRTIYRILDGEPPTAS